MSDDLTTGREMSVEPTATPTSHGPWRHVGFMMLAAVLFLWIGLYIGTKILERELGS